MWTVIASSPSDWEDPRGFVACQPSLTGKFQARKRPCPYKKVDNMCVIIEYLHTCVSAVHTCASPRTCAHVHVHTHERTPRSWKIHGGNKKAAAGLLSRGFRKQRRDRSCVLSHCFVEEGTREQNLHQSFLWLRERGLTLQEPTDPCRSHRLGWVSCPPCH